MNAMRITARFIAARRATAAIEFALVGSLLIALTFGMLSAGLLLWTKGGLQSAASMAARCGALNSPLCADVASYAVTQAQNWVVTGVITAADVTVNASATSCGGATGNFETVTITCPFWTSLPAPLSGITLTVTGCYPTT